MRYTFSFTRKPGLILSQTLADFLLYSLRQKDMTANNSQRLNKNHLHK